MNGGVGGGRVLELMYHDTSLAAKLGESSKNAGGQTERNNVNPFACCRLWFTTRGTSRFCVNL